MTEVKNATSFVAICDNNYEEFIQQFYSLAAIKGMKTRGIKI